MDLKRFLEELSSAAPTPGGGSASALAGALSASLVAMVAGLSKKNGTNAKEMEEVRKKGVSIQKRLFQAIEEDSKSFEAVLKAFRLPRNSEKERLRRAGEIQKAYRKATLTPQLVCRQSLQLLEHSWTLILKGNPNAISDAGVAAFLADAAFTGGLLNININLTAVTEKAVIRKMNILMRNWAKKRGQFMKAILKELAGGHRV